MVLETRAREKIDSFRGRTRWLSNFGDAPAMYEYVLYPTSEHAFQAAKTLDPAEREIIRAAKTPREAKRLGRKVKLRPGWDDMRVVVMRDILRSKFRDNADMRRKLLDTGDAELIEGNTWGDTFWGQVDGEGENWLGRILMEIRAELRAVKEEP